MKIMTIIGTRPEIIRLSLIIKKLDQLADSHIVVHTGQNFTYELRDIFFNEMQIRQPDYSIGGEAIGFGEQIGTIFTKLEAVIHKEKPDKALILGDTNSALTAILFERLHIPVVHMEAGNRCFDPLVPEEKNRKIIDTISTYNLPYTLNSKLNLIHEGIPSGRIFVSGNPIYEVIQHYENQIEASQILRKLFLHTGDYMLVTFHRAECVDVPEHLSNIAEALNSIAEKHMKRIICSLHPRTKSKLAALSDITFNSLIEWHDPFGFFDFVKLEKNAKCVLTDSGTVQEECCIFGVPAVTMRNTTERPETVECGSNIVTGLTADRIVSTVDVMLKGNAKWEAPEGYLVLNVSDKIVKFMLGGY